MKLLKKLKNKFKKSDTKSKLQKILKDLIVRHEWLEREIKGTHTEEELEELHKEYDAIQRLVCKCEKKLLIYDTQ